MMRNTQNGNDHATAARGQSGVPWELGRAGLHGFTILLELAAGLPRPLRFIQSRLCGVQNGGLLVRISAFDGQQEPFGGMKEMVFHGDTL
jgi:hypothetical protein